jgi:helix-hairpin-helix protein/HNH endonuclease
MFCIGFQVSFMVMGVVGQPQLLHKKYITLYGDFLDCFCKNFSQEEKIIALSIGFQCPQSHEVAEAIGCDVSIVKKFTMTREYNEIMQNEHEKRKKARYISSEVKKTVRKRDRNSCLWCKQNENLVFHHIIPVGYSILVDSSIENIALLCKECHIMAHRGCGAIHPIYGNYRIRFWEWPEQVNQVTNALGNVEGVGKRIIYKLTSKFWILENIKNASIRELTNVPYINERIAKDIINKLKWGIHLRPPRQLSVFPTTYNYIVRMWSCQYRLFDQSIE